MLAPNGSAIKIVVLCIALSVCTNFQESYSNAYPNTSIRTFEKYINDSYIQRGDPSGLSTNAFTWIWSAILNVWYLGYLLGVFVTPYVTDNYGRKITLIIANSLGSLGVVISIVAVEVPVPELLLVGRAVSSLGSGMSFGTLILFLQETTPTKLRGLTSFLSETIFLAISLTGVGFGMDAVFGRNLPLLIGIGLAPVVLALLITLPLYETPKFLLLNKDNRSAALESLIYYRGDNANNEAILDDMLKEAEGDKGLPLLKEIKMVLVTPHLRKALILGILIVQVVSCILPIIYLSTDFLSARFDAWLAQLGSFLFILFNFIASIPGMFAVEYFGRRFLLITFGILNTLSLCAYCVFDRLAAYYVHSNFRWGCMVSLILYGTAYGAALGPIAWFITSELVPQQYRSLIQSMVFSFNTVMNFIIGFVTWPVYRAIDVWGFIPLFIAPSTLCLIYIYIYLPETKGREIHEIVAQLKGQSNKVFVDSNSANVTSFTAMEDQLKCDATVESNSNCSNDDDDDDDDHHQIADKNHQSNDI